MIELSYEDWEGQFKPIKNHIDSNASFSGEMFETFGDEWEYIRSIAASNRVWTYLEGDSTTVIVEGCHFVNRLGYFVTEIAYDPNESYEVEVSNDEDRDDCLECGVFFDETTPHFTEGFCEKCCEELGIEKEDE